MDTTDATVIESRPIGQLAAALAKAQGAIKPPKKDRTVTVKGRTKDGTPFTYDFSYATLDAIMDAIRVPLSENELAVMQTVGTDPHGATCIRTVLAHSSGEWIEQTWVLPFRPQKMQEYGSLITYARRYCLAPMLGITAEEDDDGNLADHNEAHRRDRRSSGFRGEQRKPPAPKPQRQQQSTQDGPTAQARKEAEEWEPPEEWLMEPNPVPWTKGETYGGYPYPIDEAGDPSWWMGSQIVAKNAVLRRYRWDQLLEGSEDGGRQRIMQSVVQRAKSDWETNGTKPSAFAARVAIMLRRWLLEQQKKKASDQDLADAGFDPDAEHGEEITAGDIDKDFAGK